MKKIILIITFIVCSLCINATTKTYYAYVPNIMASMGTMTITYNSSYVDINFQGTNMHCDVLKILYTDDADIYLLNCKQEGTYWILALSNKDGILNKSNASFSLREMKAYLSATKRTQR